MKTGKKQVEIGLTFGQLSEVSSEIKRKFEKDNNAVNCGDFDKVLIAIVNATISKIKSNIENQDK